MRKRVCLLLMGVLTLALVIALFGAVEKTTEANRLRRAVEEAFHGRLQEVQEHLQAMALKLGKLPAAGEKRTRVELLTGVSRQADSAASAIAALPLSHAAMGDTVKFCNQVSEYTFMLALEAAAGGEMNAASQEKLSEMKSQCMLLSGQLATAHSAMTAKELLFTSDQNVFYAPVQLDARPLEQVADADNGMDYPSMIYDGAFSDARHRGTPKALGSETVTQEDAIRIARDFVGPERVRNASPGTDAGGTLESWGVTLTLHDGTILNADVTRQGGQMLWMMPEHAAFQPLLTLEECEQAARQFLSSRGYENMEANHFQVYNGLAVINFAAVQDGVLLYPDLIKVQVRMDTGELVGLESNNYLMNHTCRMGLTPSVTQQQALEKVSDALKVHSVRLCIIPYRDQERLCWEAAGVYDTQEYRVYIDASTGEELQVLMMISTPEGELSA